MDYIQPFELHIYTGLSAVLLGLIARKGFKSDVVPPMGFSGVVKTFLFASVCSYAGATINSSMKQTKVIPKPN